MKIPIQPCSVDETNSLLRALWASMRAEFGYFPWQFSPMRRGERNTIYFGWANLGLNQPVRIGVTYKRKGIATGLLFENADEAATRIKQCVETALVSEPAETTFFVTVGMSSKIHMVSATPHYQERCHPSQSQTRGLDGAEQCVVTARRSRLMSEGG
jgi:hypothetical protein